MARPDERAGDGGPVTPLACLDSPKVWRKANSPTSLLTPSGGENGRGEKLLAGDTAGSGILGRCQDPTSGTFPAECTQKEVAGQCGRGNPLAQRKQPIRYAGDDESAAAKKKPRSARFPVETTRLGRRKLRAIAENASLTTVPVPF